MQAATRVAINTFAQYVRTILNVIIGLYVTRVILGALGENDFGVYSLVAGVVGLLSFVTSAMSTATQRFLSYHQTHSSSEKLRIVFSNSLLIHVAIAIISFILLEISGIFLFEGWLNIAPERIAAAKFVFHMAVIMVILAFLASPYNAVLIAHENLVYTSVISVVDSLLKLGIAFVLTKATSDRLIVYASLMACISLFNFFAYFSYAGIAYNESRRPKLKHFSKPIVAEMSRFVGWTIYGAGCTIGRTQGVAIIINKAWSTAANAAYGVSTQIFGAILFVGSSLMAALAPQIVKAEGAGQRVKMLNLATTASKLCFLLLASVALPILFHIETILNIWLGTVPPGSVLFCTVMLISGLSDFISYGLGIAAQAIGKIKKYNLIVYTIKFSVVPIMAILIYFHISLDIAVWSYAIMELLSSFARIPLLKHMGGLSIGKFIKDVLYRSFVPILIMITLLIGLYRCSFSLTWNIALLIPIEILYVISIYYVALNQFERTTISALLARLKR